MSLFIITGGPGSGKTSLIQGLENMGYRVFQEASRLVISEQQKQTQGILPWTDLEGFQHLVLSGKKRLSHRQINEGSCFFRPWLARWTWVHEIWRLVYTPDLYGRYPKILCCHCFFNPPWQHIYKNDSA